MSDILWMPQPRQAAYISCPYDDVLFGGARGGGKTDATLGDWMNHSYEYGRYAAGIVLRRSAVELEDMIRRAQELYGQIGADWQEQKKRFIMPNGSEIRFRYLEREQDAMRYQGHAYCVGADTPVLMADGSYKPASLVAVGDRVATLEGPRRVLGVVTPYRAPCVRATMVGSGATQVQPEWHPLLTIDGVLCEPPLSSSRTGEPPRTARNPWQSCIPRRGARLGSPGADAFSEDAETVNTGFADECRENRQPRRWSALLARAVLDPLRGGLSSPRPTQSHGLGRRERPDEGSSQGTSGSAAGQQPRLALHRQCAARPVAGEPLGDAALCGRSDCQSPRGLQGRCSDGCRRGDGRPRHAAGADQASAQLQDGAEAQARACWRADEPGCIHDDSRCQPFAYIHPYTQEPRRQEVRTESAETSFVEIGEAWVCDLSIEFANHYITAGGFVNCNTRVYPEEMGNWPTSKAIDLMYGTLRSGHGIHCAMRGTANPGGPGHAWVKDRYITPAPMGFEPIITTLPSGRQFIRCFIPSKLQDNLILKTNDPGYEDRLYLVGSAALVKAWLDGDWNAVEGAYFDGWSETMILPPFPIPREWTKFRSFDWGYAKPFSVGWWAVSDGKRIDLPDGGYVRLPRGAMVRYREWYGCVPGKPNTGLRLEVEEIADGIMRMESEPIEYGVADPSIWDTSRGPSIAERFAKYRAGWDKDRLPVSWRRGENKRINGWSQMRGRMKTDGDGAPMIYLFGTCKDSIRLIPIMQHDKLKPEDLDTEAEDHPADEWRYACMSRPMPRLIPAPPKAIHPLSIDGMAPVKPTASGYEGYRYPA